MTNEGWYAIKPRNRQQTLSMLYIYVLYKYHWFFFYNNKKIAREKVLRNLKA